MNRHAYINLTKIIKLVILLTLIILLLNLFILNPSSRLIKLAFVRKDDIDSKLVDLKDFRFLINTENGCNECKDGPFVVIVVSTRITSVKRRQAIRNTWGQNTDCIKTLYFIGTTDNENKTRMIQEESDRYQDIIQGSFKDDYHNMTYKHVMELKWVTHHCQQARYVVKTDDDIVVRVDVLYENLKKDFWGETGLIACTVKYDSPVVRVAGAQWYASKEEYADDFYPTHCNGPFIVYSADVVPQLLEESNRVRFFWIDDVYVTSILAKIIGIKHTDLFKDWYLYDTNMLFLKGATAVKPFIYGPIGQSVADMYKIWDALKGA